MNSNPYEEEQILNEYLLFHYGEKEQILTKGLPVEWALGFAERCVQENLPNSGFRGKRALDIGCSVGRSSFELSKHFEEVVGIDFSNNFISAANEMRNDKEKVIHVKSQGNIYFTTNVQIPKDTYPERIIFQEGDACNLPKVSQQWDYVLAANLLCRLPNPRKFLADITKQIRTGGFLALVSPYTWMEEYTPISEWIGGTEETDKSGIVIKQLLEPDFKLLKEHDMPFLIREHERKFQLSTSHATLWQKI